MNCTYCKRYRQHNDTCQLTQKSLTFTQRLWGCGKIKLLAEAKGITKPVMNWQKVGYK